MSLTAQPTPPTNLYEGPASDRDRLRRQGEAVAERVVDLFIRHGLQGSQRVLDIGCGLGAISAAIKRRRPLTQVTGVDLDPGAIEEAQATYRNVRFLVADGAALPLPTGCYDFVAISLVLMHVQDPATVLAEAYRVLAPGGTLCVLDSDDAHFLLDPPCPAFEALKGHLAAWYGLSGSRHRGRELVRLLTTAGFTPCRHDVEMLDSLQLGSEAFASTYLAIFDVQAVRMVQAGVTDAATMRQLLDELAAATREPFFGTIAGICVSGSKPLA